MHENSMTILESLQGARKVLLRYKRRYRDEMSNNNSIHLKLNVPYRQRNNV